MSADSAIEWTDATWNPTRGCSKVSAGCTHCYAERMAARFSKPGEAFDGTITGKHWSGVVKLVPEALTIPLKWRRPRRIFVDSMSDLFHDSVPDEYIAAVFGVMAAAPRHTFQVLTKRPERMREWFATARERGEWHNAAADLMRGESDPVLDAVLHTNYACTQARAGRAPLPNVWLGVSVENQHTADERIPLLLQCPAAVRFLSCEPLLGPVDLRAIPMTAMRWDGEVTDHLQWVIVGGESGPKSRPCNLDWVDQIVDDCKRDGVPVFVKQLGANVHTRDPRVLFDLKSRKGNDPAEWPESLRVREFPDAPW